MSALTPWTMWALGGALYFYGFFQRIAPGVMVTELMRDLSMAASVLGNLSATYFYVYAAIQMPAGLLVDRYGTRRLLAGACAIAAVGSVVFAVAADAPTAFAGRLLVGIGAGFGWVGSLKIIADWFPAARFAQVSGLTLMLGLFGGLFAQGPLAAAIGAFGWRATVLAAAGIGVAVATMILAWLRDRRPPAEMPGERGLNLLAGLRSAAGNRQVWIASLHGLSVNAPVNGVIGLWGVPYLVAAYGLTRQDAAWAASVVVVGWALGSPLAGYLSDRLRRRRVTLIAGSGICALSLGAVVALPTDACWALVWRLGERDALERVRQIRALDERHVGELGVVGEDGGVRLARPDVVHPLALDRAEPRRARGHVDAGEDRKSTRLNSSHSQQSRMPSSA